MAGAVMLLPTLGLPPQIGFQIRTRVQDLGHGCIFLVQKAGALQVCPTDSYTKRELIECARAVTEKVRDSPRVPHSHGNLHWLSVTLCDQRHKWETKPKTTGPESHLLIFPPSQGLTREAARQGPGGDP